MVKIEQVVGKLHEAEGGYNPSSHAMRGILPETLAWYFKYKGIKKTVPIGQDSIGSYMKANVSEQIATEIARLKYFEPNGLNTMYYPEISGLLLGIVFHLPSLANSVVGDSLSRLGTPKAIYSDVETKKRAKQAKLDAKWLGELDTYSRRKGVLNAYNAVWDSIKALYEERGDDDDIGNRLERAWPRMDDGCQGTSTASVQGIWPNAGGGDTLVINDGNGSCDPFEPEKLSFTDKLGARFMGWWRDLTGIRYAFREPSVLPAFFRALFVVGILVFVGYGAWYWVKTRKENTL